MIFGISQSDAGAVLFCGAAAMVSLSLLWRGHRSWDLVDPRFALKVLGVVTILSWGCASLALREDPIFMWVILLALAFVLKSAAELDGARGENQIILGGLAFLPLAVQVLI